NLDLLPRRTMALHGLLDACCGLVAATQAGVGQPGPALSTHATPMRSTAPPTPVAPPPLPSVPSPASLRPPHRRAGPSPRPVASRHGTEGNSGDRLDYNSSQSSWAIAPSRDSLFLDISSHRLNCHPEEQRWKRFVFCPVRPATSSSLAWRLCIWPCGNCQSGYGTVSPHSSAATSATPSAMLCEPPWSASCPRTNTWKPNNYTLRSHPSGGHTAR